MTVPNRREKFCVFEGAIIIGLSLAVFIASIKSLISHIGLFSFSSVLMVINIIICSLGFVGVIWGILTIVFRHRKIVTNINLLLLVCLFFVPIFSEVFLRAGIAFGPDIFREPNFYTDRFADDDFYKLYAIWKPVTTDLQQSDKIPRIQYDKRLGWAYPKTDENTYGILSEIPYEIDLKKTPLLFYGDSFVAHGETAKDKIPQLMGKHLESYNVLNFGVEGYGLDQIYLHFIDSHKMFKKPGILFGIMTTDIDRCLLTIRNRPKPFFILQGSELILEGIPLPTTIKSFIEENPVAINSYFSGSIKRLYRYLLSGGRTMDSNYRREEKEAVAEKIISKVIEEAHQNDLALTFVIFSPFEGGGWRKEFLIDKFLKAKVPFIDTEEILINAEKKAGRERMDSFDKTLHHTIWANRVIAKAIADYVVGPVEGNPIKLRTK